MQFITRVEEQFQLKEKLIILWNIIFSVFRKIILITTLLITGDYHLAKREVKNWKSLKNNPQNYNSTYKMIEQEDDLSIFTDEEIQDLVNNAKKESQDFLI